VAGPRLASGIARSLSSARAAEMASQLGARPRSGDEAELTVIRCLTTLPPLVIVSGAYNTGTTPTQAWRVRRSLLREIGAGTAWGCSTSGREPEAGRGAVDAEMLASKAAKIS
jgi:hypothetical protein